VFNQFFKYINQYVGEKSGGSSPPVRADFFGNHTIKGEEWSFAASKVHPAFKEHGPVAKLLRQSGQNACVLAGLPFVDSLAH
jgi:hypothetical protein